MGRTREMIRDLLRLMPDEADETSGGYSQHMCGDFLRHGDCVLCQSRNSNFALVHIALLRKAGLLNETLLNTENLLLDTVGETRYNSMLREQTRSFCSGPSISCRVCGAKLKLHMAYIAAFRTLFVDGPRRVRCMCGATNYFNSENVPKPKGVSLNKLSQIRTNIRPRRVRRRDEPLDL
jgi:hypothetical protein